MLRTKTTIVLLTALAGSAFGQSINVEIGAASGAGSAALPSSYAACGQAGAWNHITPASPAVVALVGLNGAASGVTLSRPTGQNAVIPAGNTDSGVFRDLMSDGIPVNPSTNSDTYTFSNLQPGRYAVYVYFTNAPSGVNAAIDATGHIGESLTVVGGGVANAYRAGGNYSATLGDVGPAGTLNVRAHRTAGGQANVAGIQLVRLSGARRVLHINDNATGDNSGSSWANAMGTMHEASRMLGAMYSYETETTSNTVDYDMWVAGGTYYATPNTSIFNLDRAGTLEFFDGTRILGGFAGTESSPDQRDGRNTATVITGELGFSGPTDNTRTVMTLTGCGPSTLIDGVTITAGYNDETGNAFRAGRGGAVQIHGSVSFPNNPEPVGPVFRHVRFTNNAARREGGAVWASYAAPRFENCVFSGNNAKIPGNPDADGGAVYADNSNAVFISCDFVGNLAADEGAAVYARGNGRTTHFVNSRFLGNDGYRSTIHMMNSPAKLANTLIAGNKAAFNGAALYAQNESADLNITNCTIAHNTSLSESAGILLRDGADALIFNTLIWGNLGNTVNQGFEGERSIKITNGPTDVAFAHCSVEFGTAMQVPFNTAAYGNNTLNPMFTSPAGPDGVFGTLDDNYRPEVGSPALDAGDITFAPSDDFDLDGNGEIYETIAYDLAGDTRIVDLPTVGGINYAKAIDRGAYEMQINPCGIADLNQDGILDLADITMFITAFQNGQAIADLAPPVGVFDLADIAAFVGGFLNGCP